MTIKNGGKCNGLLLEMGISKPNKIPNIQKQKSQHIKYKKTSKQIHALFTYTNDMTYWPGILSLARMRNVPSGFPLSNVRTNSL